MTALARLCVLFCSCLAFSVLAQSPASSLVSPPAPPPFARVTLPERVELNADMISLGDVAQVEAPSVHALEVLMATPLRATPRLGESVTLSRSAIKEVLWLRAGVAPDTIFWRGAESVSVVRAHQVLRAEALVTPAARVLVQWLGSKVKRFEILPASVPPETVLPRGRLRLVPKPLTDTDTPHSRMTVWVEAWVSDEFVRMVPVTFAVQVFGAPALSDHSPAMVQQAVRQAMEPVGAKPPRKAIAPSQDGRADLKQDMLSARNVRR